MGSTDPDGTVLPTPVPLVFAIDDRYCLPLLVAWQSLTAMNPWLAARTPFVVMHEGLSDASVNRLEFHADRLELELRLYRAVLPHAPYNFGFGGARANYLRLCVLAAVTGERALYLDADIVINGDITPLLTADLGSLPLGAVIDPMNPTFATGNGLTDWTQLGIPGDRAYFNSGVLLLDLPACEREQLFDRAIEVIRDHSPRLRLWDQDALNVAANDRWARLEPRWNTAPLSALVRTPWVRHRAGHLAAEAIAPDAEEGATIMHYISPAKPWRGLLPDGPSSTLYRRHLAAVLAGDPNWIKEKVGA